MKLKHHNSRVSNNSNVWQHWLSVSESQLNQCQRLIEFSSSLSKSGFVWMNYFLNFESEEMTWIDLKSLQNIRHFVLTKLNNKFPNSFSFYRCCDICWAYLPIDRHWLTLSFVGIYIDINTCRPFSWNDATHSGHSPSQLARLLVTGGHPLWAECSLTTEYSYCTVCATLLKPTMTLNNWR